MVTSKTLLHEALPLTGGLTSGTYADANIKNYSHGMFQSVYDYPYLSSSANHLYDITMGYSTASMSSSAHTQNDKKLNLYYQMAQTLMGYGFDANGRVSVRLFDKDGDFSTVADDQLNEVFFLNFSRLLSKDEIAKGTFSMTLLTGGQYSDASHHTTWLEIRDTNAQNSFRVNSPAGEYGVLKLYNSSSNGHMSHTYPGGNTTGSVGLVFYQAGIAVITASVFNNFSMTGTAPQPHHNSRMLTVNDVLTGSNISGACDAFRSRVNNISFNNTTELNSTIYFCRANHNEFNYSANPTYLSSSQLVVKTKGEDTPVSYITTVGMYSADNELLAVAKLSEPIRKDPTTELTFRVRLDY
jgi:hypothetical protein|tara:strand:+ start:20986 stop:22050 length:1065 start_codon:yes stop_codon:yes gene_type:complete